MREALELLQGMELRGRGVAQSYPQVLLHNLYVLGC